MSQDLKKLNIAFSFIFLFIGMVLLYIAVCFSLKWQKRLEFCQKEPVKEIAFFSSRTEGVGFAIMARYRLSSGEQVHEPLFINAKLCNYETHDLAQYMIEGLEKKEWVAYLSKDGKSTLDKPEVGVKELVYLAVCFSLLIYFYILRRQVVKLSGRV